MTTTHNLNQRNLNTLEEAYQWYTDLKKGLPELVSTDTNMDIDITDESSDGSANVAEVIPQEWPPEELHKVPPALREVERIYRRIKMSCGDGAIDSGIFDVNAGNCGGDGSTSGVYSTATEHSAFVAARTYKPDVNQCNANQKVSEWIDKNKALVRRTKALDHKEMKQAIADLPMESTIEEGMTSSHEIPRKPSYDSTPPSYPGDDDTISPPQTMEVPTKPGSPEGGSRTLKPRRDSASKSHIEVPAPPKTDVQTTHDNRTQATLKMKESAAVVRRKALELITKFRNNKKEQAMSPICPKDPEDPERPQDVPKTEVDSGRRRQHPDSDAPDASTKSMRTSRRDSLKDPPRQSQISIRLPSQKIVDKRPTASESVPNESGTGRDKRSSPTKPPLDITIPSTAGPVSDTEPNESGTGKDQQSSPKKPPLDVATPPTTTIPRDSDRRESGTDSEKIKLTPDKSLQSSIRQPPKKGPIGKGTRPRPTKPPSAIPKPPKRKPMQSQEPGRTMQPRPKARTKPPIAKRHDNAPEDIAAYPVVFQFFSYLNPTDTDAALQPHFGHHECNAETATPFAERRQHAAYDRRLLVVERHADCLVKICALRKADAVRQRVPMRRIVIRGKTDVSIVRAITLMEDRLPELMEGAFFKDVLPGVSHRYPSQGNRFMQTRQLYARTFHQRPSVRDGRDPWWWSKCVDANNNNRNNNNNNGKNRRPNGNNNNRRRLADINARNVSGGAASGATQVFRIPKPPPRYRNRPINYNYKVTDNSILADESDKFWRWKSAQNQSIHERNKERIRLVYKAGI